MENWASILPLILLVIAFIFLVVRPARAKQREFQSLQSQLDVGQRVMITSGIYGELVELGDDTVDLQVAPGTIITVARHAVARVITDDATGLGQDPDASTDL